MISEQHETQQYCAVVIVTSDSCSKEPTKDQSGPYVKLRLEQTGLFSSVSRLIVSDDQDKITALVEDVLDTQDPALIITVGGTGLCPRDVTPEATSVLYERQCNGIVAAINQASLRYTPYAALNRLTAGITGGTLIINFAGKLEACKQSCGPVLPILEHALHSIRFDHDAYAAAHRRQERKLVQLNSDGLTQDSLGSFRSSSSLSGTTAKNNGPKPKGGQSSKNSSATPSNSRSSSVSRASRSNKFTIESILRSRTELSSIQQGKPVDELASDQANRPSSVTSSKKFHAKQNKQVMPAQATKPIPSKQKPLTSKIQPKVQPNPTRALPSVPLPPVPLPSVKILQNESHYAQIPYTDSLEILTNISQSLYQEPTEISLSSFNAALSCVGCTIAEDLKSKCIVPPFAVSLVDGYVLHMPTTFSKMIADGQIKTLPDFPIVENLVQFEMLQRSAGEKLFCYQVNTGGRLPKYNFAVVPTEKAKFNADSKTISVHEVKQHHFIRRAGSDLNGDDVIRAGTVICSAELSSIIAMGHRTVKVLPKPKIGVLSTGDELEDFFANKLPNQNSVVDTNGPMLSLMFRLQNYSVFRAGIAKDEPNELLSKITEALGKCDVLLITGGASMGSRDHVKDVILHMGGVIHFGRVNIKPGKPVAFASLDLNNQRKFIFSLPGNPVSAFITTLVLVNPFIKHAPEKYLRLPKKINEHLGEIILAQIVDLETNKEGYKFDGRLEFIRARIIAKRKALIEGKNQSVYSVEVSVKQQSSRLLSLVDCDCLIMIDPIMKGQRLSPDEVYPAYRLARKY